MKKIIIAVIIMMTMILSLLSFGAFADTISSVSATQDIQANTVKVNLSLSTLDISKDSVMYVAFYGENNEFMNVTPIKSPSTATTYTLDICDNASLCKVMVWEKDTLMPLCETEVVIQEDYEAEYGIIYDIDGINKTAYILTTEGEYVLYTLNDRIIFNDLKVESENIESSGIVYFDTVKYSVDSDNKINRLYVGEEEIEKVGENSILTLKGIQTWDTDCQTVDNEITELKYYKNNVDVDTNVIKINCDSPEIYTNKYSSTYLTEQDFIYYWNNGDFREIILIDKNVDGKYDFIYFTDCVSWVVDEINESNYKIYGKNAERIILDPNDEENTFEIKDINGNKLEFSDIKVGDILNIFASYDDNDNCHIDVIVSYESILGTITEYNYVTEQYKINDKWYKGYNDLCVGDKGIFKIDMYGKIIDFEIDKSDRNFGMIYKIYNDESGVDEVPTAIILTDEGEFESYTFANEVNFDGEYKTRTEMTNYADDILSLGVYILNSSNEITTLYTAGNIDYLDDEYYYYEKRTDEYDGIAEEFRVGYLNDSSIILTCEEDDYTTIDRLYNYGINTKDFFIDGMEYTYEAIVNDNDEIIVMMVFGDGIQTDTPSDETLLTMYVTSVAETTDSKGQDAIRAKGYVYDELVSIVIPYDVDGDYVDDIQVGSMIQYSGDAEATTLKILVADPADALNLSVGTDANQGYYARAGKVADIVKNTFYFEDGTTVSFPTSKTAMLVKANGRVYANYLCAGDIDTTEILAGEESDDTLILYMYDGEAIGAIIYDADNDTKI